MQPDRGDDEGALARLNDSTLCNSLHAAVRDLDLAHPIRAWLKRIQEDVRAATFAISSPKTKSDFAAK
jgi:hypothetical protein